MENELPEGFYESKLFEEVSSVTGPNIASVELLKVFQSDIGEMMDWDAHLHESFCWEDSPQGHDFWRYIQEELDPEW